MLLQHMIDTLIWRKKSHWQAWSAWIRFNTIFLW